MKQLLIAAFALSFALSIFTLGCARSTSPPPGEKTATAANRAKAKPDTELLKNATTKPAGDSDAADANATAGNAAAAAEPAPEPEPEPSRPYYPRADLAAGYAVDPNWPLKRGSAPWGGVAGAAIDEHGNVWTLNRGTQPVQVFSPEGRLLQIWPDTYIKAGHQIRIDRDGHIWVADYRTHVVRKFDRSGQLLMTIGIPDWPGTDERRLNMPTDIAFGPDGDVFISDGYRNNRIVHCDADGKFIKSWGTMGVKPGQFSLPHSIATDSQGLLYVADRNNNRVQVFDQNGQFVRAWSGMMVPWTIAITPEDEIYVIGSSPSRWQPGHIMVGIPPKDQIIMRLNRDFQVLNWWAFPFQPQNDQRQPGDVNWIHALAVDRDGNLYLGDVQGNRIQKFWAAPPTTTTDATVTPPAPAPAPAPSRTTPSPAPTTRMTRP